MAWNAVTDPVLPYVPRAALVRLVIVLLFIPMTTTTGAAALVQYTCPRRLFDAASPRLIAPVILGILTAIISIILTALAVAFLDNAQTPDNILDATATGGSSFAATLAVLLLLCRRRQPGLCLRCGYDIQGSLNFGRCPECGLAF